MVQERHSGDLAYNWWNLDQPSSRSGMWYKHNNCDCYNNNQYNSKQQFYNKYFKHNINQHKYLDHKYIEHQYKFQFQHYHQYIYH